MKIFGTLSTELRHDLADLVRKTDGLVVARKNEARSSTPFPSSNDLELGLKPLFVEHLFAHHVRFSHAVSGLGFEYDFFREHDGVAIEIMGYRADDEVYKNILKFHVHEATRVALLWVPRWKWISGRKYDVNYQAAMRALAFANSYMNVEAFVVFPYDWEVNDASWTLRFTNEE